MTTTADARRSAQSSVRSARKPTLLVCHSDTTEVAVGVHEGLRHDSCILCDALVSLPKPLLTDYVASLKTSQVRALDQALRVALALA